MMPSPNTILVACAGSGKTTYIVREALKRQKSPVLIITYTHENVDQIISCIYHEAGVLPSNLTVMTWFSFLLQHGVRPYQNILIDDKKRISRIHYQNKTNKYHRKDNYLTPEGSIYSNKVSEFAVECNKACHGLIIKRLEQIYGSIFIDELQDFAGYDLDLLEFLFGSEIEITAVGDPRQSTYSTNNSSKNRQYKQAKIFNWVKNVQSTHGLKIIEMNDCYRCNQVICDFVNPLFPDYPSATSKNQTDTGHDGIFYISKDDINAYIEYYNPFLLRYDKRTPTYNHNAVNIGLIKGRTYERVLIFPTKNMVTYLTTLDITKVGDKCKFYVAVTRARYSVAFVLDKNIDGISVHELKT